MSVTLRRSIGSPLFREVFAEDSSPQAAGFLGRRSSSAASLTSGRRSLVLSRGREVTEAIYRH